jgi:hypothetical protein
MSFTSLVSTLRAMFFSSVETAALYPPKGLSTTVANDGKRPLMLPNCVPRTGKIVAWSAVVKGATQCTSLSRLRDLSNESFENSQSWALRSGGRPHSCHGAEVVLRVSHPLFNSLMETSQAWLQPLPVLFNPELLLAVAKGMVVLPFNLHSAVPPVLAG